MPNLRLSSNLCLLRDAFTPNLYLCKICGTETPGASVQVPFPSLMPFQWHMLWLPSDHHVKVNE